MSSQLAPLPRFELARGRSFAERLHDVPARLVLKVNGTTDAENFLEIGCLTAASLSENIDVSRARRVLDFGCGLGRTLLALEAIAPAPVYTAYDIDPLMLEWCRYLLSGSRLGLRYVGSSQELADGEYDVVYAISVFSHLDDSADYWLAEIHRLLAPSGRAFLTFQDASLLDGRCPDADRASLETAGRVVVGSGSEGGAGLGVFYTVPSWEERVGRLFAIHRTVPRGLFGHQSYSVLAARPIKPAWAPLRQAYITVLERELFALRKAYRQLF